MANKLKTYRIRGVIRSNYPIDVNTTINAYSIKQAKYKLVFDVIKQGSIRISPSQLFNDVKKSKLLVTEE